MGTHATGATPQLLDQLTLLIPVVAALAAQMTQNTQQGDGADPAVGGRLNWAPEQGDDEDHDEAAGWGESGEDAFDEATWPEMLGGEWLGADDRADSAMDR